MAVIAMAAVLIFPKGQSMVCAQILEAQLVVNKAGAPSRYVAPSAPKSVEIGNYYLRTKKLSAALSRFQEAVNTDPHYAPAYEGMGKAYDRMGLRQKALEAYRKYLDELPSARDAREAKRVHKAVARLEKQLSSAGKSSSSQSPRQ
jgi:tetratricopeptide (TPR) repeat protein